MDKNKKIVTAFLPYESSDNKYIEIITSILKKNGSTIYRFSKLIRLSFFVNCDIIYLNWYENILNKNKLKSLFEFCYKLLSLLILKLFCKKIVWTMHNRQQHDNSVSIFNKLLFSFLVYFSNRIIIHSKESAHILLEKYHNNEKIESKIRYIPHPNYINIYGNIVLDKSNDRSNRLYLLFMGKIRPYKNIELLIEVVKSLNKDDVYLNIVGEVSSCVYQQKIEKQISETENIKVDFNFVPDECIPDLLQSCDLLVLPYDISSSLNSGTVILGFSYKKSVICPEIGTISDLENKTCVFSYTYMSQEDHFIQLKTKIQEAISIKQLGNGLDYMGEEVFNQVAASNSIERVQNELSKLYSELLL